MRYYSLKIVSFALILLASCNLKENSSSNRESLQQGFVNEIQKTYSPDKHIYFTINEYGLDSTNAVTQLLVQFKESGAGAYTINGVGRKINAFWKDNSTIVVETDSSYNAGQKWPQVQSMGKIVKIEYHQR